MKKPVTTGIRTWESITYVSGFLEGSLDDWPAQIQDTVLKAVEKLSHEVQLPLAVTHSYCDKDLDSTDPNKVWFVRIFLSEVVAATDMLSDTMGEILSGSKLH